MKNSVSILAPLAVGLALLAGGCNTTPESSVHNQRQPGAAVGNAVGTVVGAVGSNVAAVATGAAEGASNAIKSTYTNERRVVRSWRTETTSDGRTIQVPVEIEVDENGRPISRN
ncbi:MAG: hypothetical protein IT582_11450, partial [Opitutaceae bacterium]|nr:hypothetical protein [Opitutaceae bacterium]